MLFKELFSEIQKAKIASAITEAEKSTSGEIRVHIDKHCKGDVLDCAAFIFEQLEMQKTELRNGVLIYLATHDKKFAIIGDAGINAKVPKGFWDNTKNLMAQHFSHGNFTEGLSEGIKMAGEQLKTHFPYSSSDKNELSDQISFGNK